MARYYQKPQSPILDLTPQYPVEFYSKLIDQVQQNRNLAGATRAAYITDAQGQEYIDQASRDKVIALAQDPLAKAMDKDFVTPASMAKAVLAADKILSPWKNINKEHVEQSKREQKLRDALGANYIGNSVVNKSIMNPDGSYVSADDLKVIASNREDLQKALERDLADIKTKIRTKEIGMSLTPDGKFYKYGSKTIRGITDKEWADEFANNPEMAKLYMEQMPEFAAAVKASGQDPREFLQNEIGNITKQWVQGEIPEYHYIANPGWTAGSGPTTTFGNSISLKSMQGRQGGDKELQTLFNNASGEISTLGFNMSPSPTFGGLVNTPAITLRTGEDKNVIQAASLEKLKERFPLIAKKHSGEAGQFAPNMFLEEIARFVNDPTYFNNVVDYQDERINAGLKRRILTTINTGSANNAMAIDEEGKKVKVSSLKLKDSNMEVPQLIDNGNVMVRVDGKQYIINTTDENGAGTGVFSKDTEEPMIQFASNLDRNQFKYFDKPKDLGDVTNIKSYLTDNNGEPLRDLNGKYIYYRPKYEIVTDPRTLENVVIKTYLDDDLKPHYTGNNKPYQEIMTLGEAKAEMFDFIGASVKQEDDTNN